MRCWCERVTSCFAADRACHAFRNVESCLPRIEDGLSFAFRGTIPDQRRFTYQTGGFYAYSCKSRG
jgi:hypothetical protein